MTPDPDPDPQNDTARETAQRRLFQLWQSPGAEGDADTTVPAPKPPDAPIDPVVAKRLAATPVPTISLALRQAARSLYGDSFG